MATSTEVALKRSRWAERKPKRFESVIQATLFVCAILSVLTTVGIVTVLFSEGLPFFFHVSPWEFLTGTRWAPVLRPQSFGVLPLLWGTLQVAVGAAIVAIPMGLGCALFLSEYATPGLRGVIKPLLEILAGIPTVVYGYFAVTTVTPALTWLFPSTEVFNAASAAIVVGIMVLPMIASLADDALNAVPRSLRDGGYALGATKAEVSTQILLPGAASGILAAFVLAISRAIGETMAVTLAAGANPTLSLNFLESIQTMTAFMVQISMGDVEVGSIEYQTLFAVGILLFLMTLGMNLLSHWVVKKFNRYQ